MVGEQLNKNDFEEHKDIKNKISKNKVILNALEYLN